MYEKEKKMPVTGLTLSEMAATAGASVEMCAGTKDLEQRVISGEAATMGEALQQHLAELSLMASRFPNDFRADQVEWIDCGTLHQNEDGTYSIVDTQTLRLQEERERLADARQLKFWRTP